MGPPPSARPERLGVAVIASTDSSTGPSLRALTAAGAGLTLVAGRTRAGQIAAGALLAAGSLLTRFGVFDAGTASARDPSTP